MITVIKIQCSRFTEVSEAKGQNIKGFNFVFSPFTKVKNN